MTTILLRVTDYKWLQVTESVPASYYEWVEITMRYTSSDNEWLRVTTSECESLHMTTGD